MDLHARIPAGDLAAQRGKHPPRLRRVARLRREQKHQIHFPLHPKRRRVDGFHLPDDMVDALCPREYRLAEEIARIRDLRELHDRRPPAVEPVFLDERPQIVGRNAPLRVQQLFQNRADLFLLITLRCQKTGDVRDHGGDLRGPAGLQHREAQRLGIGERCRWGRGNVIGRKKHNQARRVLFERLVDQTVEKLRRAAQTDAGEQYHVAAEKPFADAHRLRDVGP